MIGDQIKFEPAWCTQKQKQLLKDTDVNDCLSSAAAGLNRHSITRVRKIKRDTSLANHSQGSMVHSEERSRFRNRRSLGSGRKAQQLALSENKAGHHHMAFANVGGMAPEALLQQVVG